MDDRLRNVEVHLGRVEQRVEDHEGDIRSFGSLPVELERVRWAQEQMAKSLDAVHDAQRELAHAIEERKHEIEAAREERQMQIEAIEIARRDNDREFRDRDEQRKLENRRLFYGLVALLITSLVPLISNILGGAHP